jgi:putative transposase
MDWFKTMTTNAYIRGVREHRWKPFPGRFWQRSYHDCIIRNERELDRLRKHTLYNAARWKTDTLFSTEIGS